MGDVDYGYGDSADYGYGDDAPADYGYGDDAPSDYGYGDSGGNEDYGYGDAAPDQDYGYGDAAPDQDYGYGDAAPDDAGYGYEDEAPVPLPPKTEKRPKRRCSVTRFSIEAEANDKPLDYNWTPEQAQQQPEQPAQPVPAADEKSSAQTESTVDTNEGGSMIDKIPVDKLNMPKKGMMSRIRKRLSIM